MSGRVYGILRAMAIVALGLFVVSVLLAVGEIVFERDWPRDTWKFVAISAICLIASVAA